MPAAVVKPTKNQLRRAKKKANKSEADRSREPSADGAANDVQPPSTKQAQSNEAPSEDDFGDLTIESTDPIYAQFKGLIESFGKTAQVRLRLEELPRPRGHTY